MNPEKVRKLAAAAIVSATPAVGQEPSPMQPSIQSIPNQKYETFKTPDYTDDRVENPEVMEIIHILKDMLPLDARSITTEQVDKIHTMIDNFIERHQSYEGKTLSDGSIEASYSSPMEIYQSITRDALKMNPLVFGFASAYCLGKMQSTQQTDPVPDNISKNEASDSKN